MALRIGILTISDRASAGTMEDRGGPAVRDALQATEHDVARTEIVPDDHDAIVDVLALWCDVEHLDVIFTTGGTGLGPRDVTPEATQEVGERVVPGIAVALRIAGLAKLPQAMLSRGTAVQRGRTLIINLPGSPSGAREGVEQLIPVLEHAVLMMGDARH
jgi:molybdenum cofactor synthesis domain-containing protein